MVETLKQRGAWLSWREELKMVVKTEVIWSVQCFRVEDNTPSEPAALQLFCFLKSYLTPCSSTMKGGGRVVVLDGEAVMVRPVNNSTMANTLFLCDNQCFFCGIHQSWVAIDLHLEKSLHGAGLGKGDMEDKLLSMQQVPPSMLLMQSKGKARVHTAWHQCCHRSCQNDVDISDELP